MRTKNYLVRICVVLASIVVLLLGYLGMIHFMNKLQQDEQVEEVINEEPKTFSADLMFAGDFVIHKPIIDSRFYQSGENDFDFSDIFYYIRDVYREGTFTLATIEGALCDSNYRGYPLFRTPSQLLDDLKNSGIDLINMASNHVYDDFHQGLINSIETLKEKKLDYQGVRTSPEAKNYYVKEIKGIKVGFFNYVYETMDEAGNPGINGITLDTESLPLINTYSEYDLEGLYSEVQVILDAMKEEGVEFIVANMHWGREYEHMPSYSQKVIAQQFCDMGVDALIGSHPHVIQTTDLVVSSNGTHEMLCAYSLGNHLSNQRIEYMDGISNGNTEDGLMVKLSLFKDENGDVSVTDVTWIPTWVYYEYDSENLSYYQIMPLDRYQDIMRDKKLDFDSDAQASLKRTNDVIGEGVSKIQAALPLK